MTHVGWVATTGTVCPCSSWFYIIFSYHHGRRQTIIFSTDLLLGFLDHFIVWTRKIIIYLTHLKKILWKGDNNCWWMFFVFWCKISCIHHAASDKNKMNNTISILQLPFYMILIETISGLIWSSHAPRKYPATLHSALIKLYRSPSIILSTPVVLHDSLPPPPLFNDCDEVDISLVYFWELVASTGERIVLNYDSEKVNMFKVLTFSPSPTEQIFIEPTLTKEPK